MHQWPARYPGPCAADCGVRIKVDDVVEWHDPSPDERTVRHVVCPEAPDPLAAAHPPCPDCFLVHPPGTCDR